MWRDDRLRALIEPVAQSFGCELWGVEISAVGGRQVLRVFIDKPDGVDIGDCERVSRQLDSLLDVENPIPGEYTLEVSSPGMDRTLYRQEQFRRFVGYEIAVRLRNAFEGRRKYQGTLTDVADEEITVVSGEHEYLFPLAEVEKANLLPRFDGNA